MKCSCAPTRFEVGSAGSTTHSDRVLRPHSSPLDLSGNHVRLQVNVKRSTVHAYVCPTNWESSK